MMLGTHPDDDAEDSDCRHVLATYKANLGPPVDSLAFRIVHDADLKSGRLVWEDGPVFVTADDLLHPNREAKETRREQAIVWLHEYIADGAWHDSSEVKKAGEAAGFKPRTLERARQDSDDIVSMGKGRNCTWRLTQGDDCDGSPNLERFVPRVRPPSERAAQLRPVGTQEL